MKLQFTKMQGAGNDFVVLDAVSESIQLTKNQIQLISDRHFGIGCDQILMVEPPTSPDLDFFYRIFNADGSESGQCGNGARCFALFVKEKGLIHKNEIKIGTESQQMSVSILENEQVRVHMGTPRFEPKEVPLMAEKENTEYEIKINNDYYRIGAVSLGNPHAVQLVGDLESADIQTLGPLIEKHEMFPDGVNVGFMQRLNSKYIRLRVYERGVGETLACGSGACAAVAVGQKMDILDSVVEVDLPGGRLTVEWHGGTEPMYLTGPATKVFEGRITL